MSQTKSPAIRSIPLDDVQKQTIVKKIEEAGSIGEAAIKMRVSDATLGRLNQVGSCSQKTFVRLFGKKALLIHKKKAKV